MSLRRSSLKPIRYLAAIPLLFLFVCVPAHAAEGLSVEPVAGVAAVVAPGQADVMLLKLRVTAEDGTRISGITFSFTGTAAVDIAALRLYQSATPGWDGTVAQPALAGGTISSDRVSFSGFALDLDTGSVTYLTVKADIASGVTDGDAVSGEISDHGDITATGHVTGTFPLRSIDPSGPSRINVVATTLAVADWPAGVTAGAFFSFTVSCIDSRGNLDRDWAGSTLSITGTPGYEPGTADSGAAPVYGGGGIWSVAEGGRRSCACCLYKVETGRRIRALDSMLGSVDSTPVSVTAGPPGSNRIAIAPVSNQVAGVPFAVTVYATDAYGNPLSGHAGSVTVLSSETGVTASPGGYAPVLPSYSWRGDELSGRAVMTIVTYNQYSGAQLKATDPELGTAVSGAFTVVGADAAAYSISGPTSVRLRTETVFTSVVTDTWGNVLAGYNGTAHISCTDPAALCQSALSFVNGTGSFSMLFPSGGSYTIGLRESGGNGVEGKLAVTVDRPPLPSKFVVSAPSRVRGGAAFNANIAAIDAKATVIAEYSGAVSLSVPKPAAIVPSAVYLASGSWSGSLAISGETLQAGITLSDGEVTTANAAVVTVDVADYAAARTYPTVFRPRDGAVRIRYFLREDSAVHIKIYNAAMDLIREMGFAAGAPGGRAGLNAVDWDGRGGSDGSIGHSGGYPIVIDKGYEKEWTGAVIKNY